MFRKKKQEERGVIFHLGEAVGKYTDTVIEQINAKNAEIERLRTAAATFHVNLLRLRPHPEDQQAYAKLEAFTRHICAGETAAKAVELAQQPTRDRDTV